MNCQRSCFCVSTYTAVIHKEGDLYVADCPEVGCVSQGSTIESALKNLKEATELYLEATEYVSCGHTYITTFNA
ncbi:MAG: type II toxin-antitoxin system HicB family antitoxin [Synergistaceae bacterium]|nr:type II toxin-antitoxin system HicB family antitoxin [Synergistaceae bacterium]